MTGAAWLLLTLLLIWGGVAALRRRMEAGAGAGRRAHGRPAPAPHGDDDEIDHEMLEQAELEAKGMGSDERGAPLDDEPGNDWGPGTARNPWGHGG